jgi:hypothetical protein
MSEAARRLASAERAARIASLFQQGLTDDQIAAEIGTDRDTVRATRSRLGLRLSAAERTRLKSNAPKKECVEFSGHVKTDGPLQAPDVSHIYQGRRYDDRPPLPDWVRGV